MRPFCFSHFSIRISGRDRPIRSVKHKFAFPSSGSTQNRTSEFSLWSFSEYATSRVTEGELGLPRALLLGPQPKSTCFPRVAPLISALAYPLRVDNPIGCMACIIISCMTTGATLCGIDGILTKKSCSLVSNEVRYFAIEKVFSF